MGSRSSPSRATISPQPPPPDRPGRHQNLAIAPRACRASSTPRLLGSSTDVSEYWGARSSPIGSGQAPGDDERSIWANERNGCLKIKPKIEISRSKQAAGHHGGGDPAVSLLHSAGEAALRVRSHNIPGALSIL